MLQLKKLSTSLLFVGAFSLTSWAALTCLMGQETQPETSPNGNQKSTVLASSKSELPDVKTSQIDLEQIVTFTLAKGEGEQIRTVYSDLSGKQKEPFNANDSKQIAKNLLASISAQDQPRGVLIRVPKNIKYRYVNEFYRSIQLALKQGNSELPIYISVQDPKQKQSDETRTQEFILQNRKAADLYDRVSNVAKVFKVSVRLDPSRNSITAKGPSSKVTAIQNLITFLDKGEALASTPKESTESDLQPKTEIPSVQPPTKNTQGRQDPALNPNPSIESPSAGTTDSPKSKSVGRYQINGIGGNLILLDTATGETWYLNTNGQKMSWIKLPFLDK